MAVQKVSRKSKKQRQSLHNREVGRYVRQRARTEANKARRRQKEAAKAAR